MRTKLLVLTIVMVGSAALLLARAQAPAKTPVPDWKAFHAPAEIKVREAVEGAPAGWAVAADEAPHILAGITFYDGPPSEMASLVYDSEKKAGQRLVLTWSFDPDAPRGSWIRCRYAGTNAVLDQQLPKGVSGARVTLDTQVHVDGYEQILSIELR